jgi:hypothetical protein
VCGEARRAIPSKTDRGHTYSITASPRTLRKMVLVILGLTRLSKRSAKGVMSTVATRLRYTTRTK